MKTVLLFILIGMCNMSLLAQQTVSSAGKEVSGTGGTVSYTIGQVVYTTNTGSNGTVTQGVQQPFEISVITGIEEAKGISLEISIYPNPATDLIKLKIENYEIENLRYQIYDINGNLLLNNKVEGNETSIVISNLVSATYLLKVTDNNKVIKTFKVIKN